MWKEVKGYDFPYRISDMGIVQRFRWGKWVEIIPHITSCRAKVGMWKEGKRIAVPVVNLMADAYMGGQRKGMCIIHKDGSKLNNAAYNLKFVTRPQAGKISCQSRRKTVLKISPDGEVVAIFRSVIEAAKKDFLSRDAVRDRCVNKIKDPFKFTGYNYQYEETYGRKKRGKNSDQPAWE